MNMQSRNEYLKALISERGYLSKSKKEKSALLDDYCATTGMNRDYLIRKIRSASLWKENFGKRKRKEKYDGEVRAALAAVWRIFDYPCGQRLESTLKLEVERLRAQGELHCSDAAARKLAEIDASTIDAKLKRAKETERIKRKEKIHPLLYQKIPVKVFDEQDRAARGTIQIDLVEHCGQSAAGEFVHTLSTTDISLGWWEGEAIMGRPQERTFAGLSLAKERYPFSWLEIHSDNDTAFINGHLLRYTQEEKLSFSRSRPYKKNDNCLVEQKNNTHIRRYAGWMRYDTEKERGILNDLYRNELRLYKNFFQPVIKLVSKERLGGRIRRKYDTPRTPYQRLLECADVPGAKKEELQALYRSLNPAALKRTIDKKLDALYRAYRAKTGGSSPEKVAAQKKLQPNSLTFYIRQPKAVSLT